MTIHFSVERMLKLADFSFHTFSGMEAELHICRNCLPLVVPEGIEFQHQCGEDNLLTGHVFVENTFQDGTAEPAVQYVECVNCHAKDAEGWGLRISLEALEYVADRDLIDTAFDWNSKTQVVIMGKRGRIVGQLGWSPQRPWIQTYTIKFEDGTKFDAYRWQFKVVKS